ncbi:MAG: ribonuclease HI [Lachnospiraceae bacterium]|nr:ribonuclease HI [Lachnospiraceae bacterium]
MHVTIYTDGSARGNPDGPGGYGALVQYVDPSGTLHEREYAQGYDKTTNNRMELMGVIVALEHLTRPCIVDIYADSQYVIHAMTKGWLDKWQQNGWRTSGKDPVKNRSLWLRLIAAARPHEITWHWVRGHAGHPENERCDALATAAADAPPETLLHDDGESDLK